MFNVDVLRSCIIAIVWLSPTAKRAHCTLVRSDLPSLELRRQFKRRRVVCITIGTVRSCIVDFSCATSANLHCVLLVPASWPHYYKRFIQFFVGIRGVVHWRFDGPSRKL